MEKTNEATSTPGPWEAWYEDEDIHAWCVTSKKETSPHVPEFDCLIGRSETPKEIQEANAKLIASVPDLVAENQKLKTDNEALRISAHFQSDDDVEANLRNQVYQLQADKAELIEMLTGIKDMFPGLVSHKIYVLLSKLETKAKNVPDNLCSFCGLKKEDHHGASLLCYHYSDEDSDHFYKDRTFKAKNV